MASPTTLQPTEYVTRDLPLAAWLVTVGEKLVGVRTDGARALFVFTGTAEAVARRFFEEHQDVVLVRRFHRNLRELRGLAREAIK
jgi:hypothetical protein